jgi:predicted XRE-type DNA-binding protein
MPKTRRARKLPESVIPKAALATEIARILDERGLTQIEAAYEIKDSPSQMSLIVNGKLRGFSSERLIGMLAGFGRDVDIVIRNAKGSTGKVRVVSR